MMRKSPGKWIKTLLLGKKSFKSRSSKGRASVENAEGPVISEPLSISTGRIEAKPQLENEVKYDVACGGHESIPDEKDPDLTAAVIEDSNYSERSSKEQAAMRAQSAFRGYLARRAFRALKGIIRLQAVIRGHLVRRQAVATLKCTWGIVRFQMLARSKKFSQTSDLQDASHVRSFRRIRSSLQGKDSVNAFIRKILSFSIIAKPLKIQYHQRDPNEALTWLERWTSSKFWKSPTLQKNYVDPTSKETPRSRPKFSVRRNFGIKKIPSPTVQENSESELEKVKRSLRKVSSASGQLQTCLIEKVNDVIIQDSTNRKVNSDSHELSGSTDQEQVKGGSAEDNTNDYNRTLTSDEKPSVDRQRGRKINAEVEDYTGSIDQEQVKGRSVEDNSNGNNGTLTSVEKPSVDHRRGSKVNVEAEDYSGYTDQQQVKNGGVKSPPGEEEEEEEEEEEDNNGDNGALTFEEKDSVDHRRGSKRRASFPAKSEQVENGVQNTPVLPSYMAATQSAKAKFFGHGVEKAAFIRRHSLPSAKPASISPRTQKVCQPSCKAIVKEKPVPVAWKR